MDHFLEKQIHLNEIFQEWIFSITSFQDFFFTAIIDNNQCQRPVVRLVDGSSSGEMHQLSKEVAQAAAAAPSPPSLTPPLPSLRLLPPLERSEASVASVFTQQPSSSLFFPLYPALWLPFLTRHALSKKKWQRRGLWGQGRRKTASRPAPGLASIFPLNKP